MHLLEHLRIQELLDHMGRRPAPDEHHDSRGDDLLVETLESAAIETAAEYGIEAYARRDAPGVYVDGRKLAAIGLRVRRGCCYHGMAFNVAMDLAPYARINPCGYEGLEVTQLSELCEVESIAEVRPVFERALERRL